MTQQIKLLLTLQIRESYGFNEARYSKDAKKRRRIRLLAATFVFLGLLIMFYISMLTFGFISLGVGKILPEYLFAITSLIVFFFSLFKAGDMIFNIQSYERLISLPLKPSAIISSRFLHMYLSDAVMAYAVMLPATIIYGISSAQDILFYIFMLVSTLFIPLLPMTVATIFGALVLSISSRMKHKKTVSVALSMIFILAVIILPTYLSSGAENLSDSQITDFALMLSASIKQIYPPAALYSTAASGDNLIPYALFTVATVAVFLLFVFITKQKFASICTALNSTIARRNFVMSAQSQSSPLKSLFKKELRRFFSSSIYIMNTSIGYILMLILVIFGAVSGVDKISQSLELPFDVVKVFPYLLAVCCTMSPPTTSAVSLEGNRWWIMTSLPVSAKNVFDSKILVTLAIAAPFYALSAPLSCIFFAKSFADVLSFIFVPAIYIVFSAVLGLFVNIKMPMMTWESETIVVKQSGAVLVSMLIGFVSIIAPVAVILAAPTAVSQFATPAILVVLLAITAALYRANNKVSLVSIG